MAEWVQAGGNIWNVMKRKRESESEREREREGETEWLMLTLRSHVIEESPENATDGGSAEAWPEVITVGCEPYDSK